MRYTILGRTGLRVSVMGLGASTKFASLKGNNLPQAEGVLSKALEHGINLIDTAAIYNDSEAILGELLKNKERESYVLSSKYFPVTDAGQPIPVNDVRMSIERSLSLLKTDYLDILQIHGVGPESYRAIIDQHLDTLRQLKTEGKFRFLGITETIKFDPHHRMMKMALEDDLFDTAMISYNLLSPDPEKEILPMCQKQDVGVIGMAAVRQSLGENARLEQLIREAKQEGRIAPDALEDSRPLDWLLEERIPTLTAAGYSYVLAEPSVSTVLSGTTDPKHLIENIQAMLAGPLPHSKRKRLQSIFRTPPNYDPWSTYDL